MPNFNTEDEAGLGAGSIAGIGGAAGAIPVLNVFSPAFTAGWANQGKQQTINQMLENASMLQGPSYGSDAGITNEYSGNFSPEMYKDPKLAQYQLAQDSAEGRAAQLAALQSLGGLVDQSAASSSRLGRQTAETDARQLAQSREGSIRQDAMRRGQVGGAADMIGRQVAAQGAANQNLNAGLQNAQQAALMQLAGTQATGQLAGQLRGQDQTQSFGNAGIINAFNMANTNAQNQMQNANTQLGNAAQLRNLDAGQQHNNNATNLAMQKLQRGDRNANSQYQAQMDQYGAIDQGLRARAGLYDTAGQQGIQAGQIGYNNFKDLMKMVGGGM